MNSKILNNLQKIYQNRLIYFLNYYFNGKIQVFNIKLWGFNNWDIRQVGF